MRGRRVMLDAMSAAGRLLVIELVIEVLVIEVLA